MYWGRCQNASCWCKLALTFMEWRLLELFFFNVLFCFWTPPPPPRPHPPTPHPPGRTAGPPYINITGSFASEAIVLLWLPHVCTLPLSTSLSISLSLSRTFFIHFSTLLCVYTYVHCMYFHSIDNNSGVYCCNHRCMHDRTSIVTWTPPPLGPWRNHNGQPLDNVIHWRSIHKSNIG